MSGRLAPLRTATPMPERARSTRLPDLTLPCLVRSSIASAVKMATSPPAPVSRSLRRACVDPQVTASFASRARSNAGMSSSSTDFTPLVQRTCLAAIIPKSQMVARWRAPLQICSGMLAVSSRQNSHFFIFRSGAFILRSGAVSRHDRDSYAPRKVPSNSASLALRSDNCCSS